VEQARFKYARWKSQAPDRRIKRILREMEWGKRVFRNPTQISEQFRGRYFHLRAKLGGLRLDPDGKGAESRRLGYRPLGRIASAGQMQPLQKKLNDAFSVERLDDFHFKGSIATRSLPFALNEIPELMSLLTPQVLDAVRQYYGSNFRLYNVAAWRNWHIPSTPLVEEAYSNNWHTDSRRIDMLKVFVTGTDVSDDDGPTHALSREWTKEVVRKGFNHRRDYGLPVSEIENPQHLVKLTGPAGTALLCNTNLCFHRAGVPGEGRCRDLIEFRFIASPEFSLTMPDNDSLPLRDRIVQ
jgi:hypothetical protein